VETLGEQERDLTEGIAREASEQFRIDARDFLSARERGRTTGTRIDQQTAALSEAAEIVNRSFPTLEPSGRFINAISPVVIPNRQSLFWRLMPIGMMVIYLFVGAGDARDSKLRRRRGALALFGPHLWLLLVLLAFSSWWRQSVVMVPDGCRALVTRFGKLEEVVEAGRKLLFNPWKQVSYIVNTTRDYPYNAPIREAPTASRVNASVDLFLQFRIEDPAEFIFVARMLEKQETEAQRVRLEIETRGRAALTEAENEATALRHLGQAHRDNRAVVRYELARRRVEVGERLMQRAPRPVLIRGEGGEQSALSTLILARLLPQLTADGSTVEKASEALRDLGDGEG
jgi:hypothetical protein